jgi:hypothetical protein
VSHLLNIILPLNREDTIFCKEGKSIAIDSKINYLTRIKYRMRARSRRPKDDVGISVNLASWLELKVPMIIDDIHKLGLGIRCGRHGLETEGCIPLCNINGVVWSGYSLLALACLTYLFVLWACWASADYSVNSEKLGLCWERCEFLDDHACILDSECQKS